MPPQPTIPTVLPAIRRPPRSPHERAQIRPRNAGGGDHQTDDVLGDRPRVHTFRGECPPWMRCCRMIPVPTRAPADGWRRTLYLLSCGIVAIARRHPYSRLLLRVSFERPVKCVFTVGFEIRQHPSDSLRGSLPLLLAANRFVFDFSGRLDTQRPVVWIAAPVARECVLDVLSASGV